MAKKAAKKTTKKVANPEAETVVDTVEVEEATGTVAEVVNGAFTARTYSKEKHGDNFAELAKEYADNHGGEVKVR